MKQTYIINNCKSFRVKDVFDCGQCFRWNEELDKSYTGIFGKNVLNVKQEPDEEGYKITFTGVCNGNIEDICKNYFDLNRDYEEIKNKLSKIDEFMAQSISYGEGIRILNQDLWEMIISFIISANNNIPRIKAMFFIFPFTNSSALFILFYPLHNKFHSCSVLILYYYCCKCRYCN